MPFYETADSEMSVLDWMGAQHMIYMSIRYEIPLGPQVALQAHKGKHDSPHKENKTLCRGLSPIGHHREDNVHDIAPRLACLDTVWSFMVQHLGTSLMSCALHLLSRSYSLIGAFWRGEPCCQEALLELSGHRIRPEDVEDCSCAHVG